MNREEFDDYHLTDANDANILMHRDVHFGGSFDVMLEYYIQGGKGVNPHFEIEKIQALAEIEKSLNQNMAAVILTGADAEKVARAKEAYKQMRSLYETKNPYNRLPILIADLILSEKEEALEEIAAIVKEKNLIVPSLLHLIQSEDFHDPLFPGYGLAPSLAMKCLSLIGDKRAIITLFEEIGTGDFFDEDIALVALRAIGEPAKKFLLNVVQGKPLNADNEKAAIALIAFKEDPEVGNVCLKMLQDPSVFKDEILATYLILVCEGLNQTSQQQEFRALADHNLFPKNLQRDLQVIINAWPR
jgi:hypothetical protein